MPLAFYPFRYRDSLTGKWVVHGTKPRSRSSRSGLRVGDHGPAEHRVANPVSFSPYRDPIAHAELTCLEETGAGDQPATGTAAGNRPG